MPMQSGTIESLQINIRTRQPTQRLETVSAVTGAGLQGCRHSKPGNERSIVLVEAETLDELGLEAGEIKENITTRGIELRGVTPGSQLQIGEGVMLEVTGPCDPCRRMEEIRQGLQADLQGRRGITARVLSGGQIRLGDSITLAKPGRRLP